MTGPYPPQGPPPPYPPPYGYPPPDNNLVWAILATVFCCLPLGIVAIVKSSQVNTLWYQGYPAEAQRAADEARKWAMWSALSIAILIGVYLLFLFGMLLFVGRAAWWLH
ncbi:CD225/dispanin family protein [Amycolatopsis benzoatilytica]|uniref:CD225/dispanin family protein n=1 Tax=Amycolatopsis benzoatilytica TaxID=346045 RepID=UPI00037C5559|nr:CD225/dispanin family protein [Amycolatopsis benzoatilytica]